MAALLPLSACDDAGLFGFAGLNGSFGDTWEPLAAPATTSALASLQSYHYAGMPYIYDFSLDVRYDVANNTWSDLPEEAPFDGSNLYANAATDSDNLWVARDDRIYRFELATETWHTFLDGMPDGGDEQTAAVYDNGQNFWYLGEDRLIRVNPYSGDVAGYEFLSFNFGQTRLAYDPLSHRLVVAGTGTDRFRIFDLGSRKWMGETSASPGGDIRTNSCQDRSGGIYTGSSNNTSLMYRYDIVADTWTVLPTLPAAHDDQSTCVVSNGGYLYYATASSGTLQFFRLPLGR